MRIVLTQQSSGKESHKQKDCLTGKNLVQHLIMHPEDWFWNLMVIEFNAWNSRANPCQHVGRQLCLLKSYWTGVI